MRRPAVPPPANDRALPKQIANKLQTLIERAHVVTLLRGLLGVLAAGIAVILALMAIDAVVTMPSLAPRLLLTLAGLGIFVAAWFRFLARPLRRRISSLTGIARMLEVKYPGLHERISSAVEFRGPRKADAAARILPRGSETLIAAVVAEAVLDAEQVDPQKEVRTRSILPFLITALTMAMLMVLVFVLWPRHASTALLRVIAPVLNVDSVGAVDLEVKPGDQVLILGDPMTIEAGHRGGDLTGAELEIVDSTGYESQRPGQLTLGADGRAALRWDFPSVMSSFQYRVRARAALSRYYQVTAMARPKIEATELHFHYPEYTGLKPQVVQEPPEVVAGVVGTRVTLKVTANVPVAHPKLNIGGKLAAAPTLSQESAQGPVYAWTVALSTAGTWRTSLVLEEKPGIASEPLEFEIRAVPDGPPRIDIVEPTSPGVTLKPQDRLALKYTAEDDFGLTAIEMLVSRDEEQPASLAQPLPKDAPKPFRACQGQAVLNLADLDLAGTQQVTVRMRARDTLPEAKKGPNVGTSKPLVITIERPAQEPIAQAEPAKADDAQLADTQKLEDLAQREEQLEKQAAQGQPDAAQDPKLQQEEKKLAEELAAMVKATPDALRAELQADQQQAQELAKDAKALAEEQQALRQESQALADPAANREQLRQQILDQIAKEEKSLAAEVAKAQAAAEASNPAEAKQLGAAKEAMDKALRDMGQDAGAAAAEAHQAQEQLQQAAASAGQAPPTATQPGQQQLQNLARSQENIAKALDAVKKDDLSGAVAQLEAQVQQESQQLSGEAKELGARAEALGLDKQVQGDAQGAAEGLAKAAQGAGEAKDALAKSAAAAGDSQQQAAENLSGAAERLERLGQELGQKADALGPPSTPSGQAASAAALASAMDHALEAANAANRQQAAAAAHQAGKALAQAAHSSPRPLGKGPGVRAASSGKRSPSSGTPQAHSSARGKSSAAGQSGGVSSPEARHQAQGKIAPAAGSTMTAMPLKPVGDGQWARFRGRVKSEAQADAGRDAPEDYRELVNRYFQELSRQAAERERK